MTPQSSYMLIPTLYNYVKLTNYMDQNDPENYSTNFRSVICYGHARVVEDADEYYKALVDLTTKFVKGVHNAEEIAKQIEIERAQCGVTAIDIEFMTGKEAIELVQAKAKNQ